MKVFKIHPDAIIPQYATQGSAAFDLSVCLDANTKIRSFNPHNREMFLPTKEVNGKWTTTVMPEFRTLLPTGLKFDIPNKHLIKLNIRSSMALKYGLSLANQTAIIDSDYTDELFIMVLNQSDTPIQLYHGDRVAQGMVEKAIQEPIVETLEDILPKGDRVGGLGSTGVNEIKRGPGRPRKDA